MGMRTARWASALVLLLLVNVVVLGGAAWNRSGPPEATLTLTERELPMSRSFVSDENSGVGLNLQLCGAGDTSWFDEAKLKALGFDPEAYIAQDEASRKRPLPRRAYAVLEFSGPAWEEALRRERQKVTEPRAQIDAGEAVQGLEAPDQRLRRMQTRDSRLVPVDAGNDPQALRKRYPDSARYVITPAQVRMYRCFLSGCETPVYGRVTRILTRSIHVPVEYHGILAEALGRERPSWGSSYYDKDVPGPRYRVTLHYGSRYEPWIAGIEAIEPPRESSGSEAE